MVNHSKYWSSGALKYILCIFHEMKIQYTFCIFFIFIKIPTRKFWECLEVFWFVFFFFHESGKNKMRREKGRFNLVKKTIYIKHFNGSNGKSIILCLMCPTA